MRKIHKISNVFAFLGLDLIFLKLRQLLIKDIPILAYHRVVTLENENDYPFDVELISASKEEFLWQMQYVKKNFNPITLAMLIDSLEGKIELPKNPIVITFDDGFDDNYHIAFPILKELEIPATIFISTSYIETDETFWYEKLANFLLSHETEVEVPELDISLSAENSMEHRRENYSRMVEKLKQVPNVLRLECIENLFDKYNVDYSSVGLSIRQLSATLSWSQLKEMSDSVFEIGSHSVTHPVLSTLSDSKLAEELENSKSVLESKLGIEIKTIAYPVGMEYAFNSEVEEAAKRAGYSLALSYIEGENYLNNLSLYALKRLHVDRGNPRSIFACKLALPSIFNDQ